MLSYQFHVYCFQTYVIDDNVVYITESLNNVTEGLTNLTDDDIDEYLTNITNILSSIVGVRSDDPEVNDRKDGQLTDYHKYPEQCLKATVLGNTSIVLLTLLIM